MALFHYFTLTNGQDVGLGLAQDTQVINIDESLFLSKFRLVNKGENIGIMSCNVNLERVGTFGNLEETC